MNKKHLLIIGFILVLAAAVWYFRDEGKGGKNTGEHVLNGSISCMPRTSEPPFPTDVSTINWGLVWWNIFGLPHLDAMETGNSKGIGWLKGHDIFPSERAITLYKSQIIAYAAQPNALNHQDVLVGEFLC